MESFRQFEPPTTKITFDASNIYHVFLSFRGPDVRKKFVDHLYESLSTAGLRVFLDSEELKKGEGIDGSLKEAIEKSDILIPIFSQRYAESTWCLEEADRMRRSKGLVIPLFYDVEPSDVRYPRRTGGKFKGAFEKHYSRLDRQDESTILNWEIALREISGLSGWTAEAESGYEARLVKRVVKDVLDTLQKNAQLHVAMHPTGLERSKRELVNLLYLSSKNTTLKVGIIGLGGVGKTTLAKAVYNEIQGKFDECCFLFDIGGRKKKGTTLEALQRRILKDLVEYDGEVSSVDAGKVLMRDRLRRVRDLVILDDVNDMQQLGALNGDWFAPGSRLIIISRDRHILHLADVKSVHEMNGLTEGEALQLFSCHAFSRTFPEKPYEKLSRRIAKACWGIPLALIVMGAHLADKKEPSDVECWEEAVMNILGNPDIFTVLRISYDGLNEIEKKIFLDIACCLVGQKEKEAVIFWKVLHPHEVRTTIKNLSLKMLINTSGSVDYLDMHSLVQQMGIRIQEELDNNSRVWLRMSSRRRDLNADRLERVNMLVYNGENGREPFRLQSMPELQYLSLYDAVIVDNIRDQAPNLIWIIISNCEFLSDSNIWRIVRQRIQVKSWSELRIFSLKQCASIKTIPNTVNSLVNLHRLCLWDCASLITLPNGFGNCLVNLQHFDLRDCPALTTLPDTLGNLSRLEVLHLCGCASLKRIPDTLGDLKRLICLCVARCTCLKSLPQTISNLGELQGLHMGQCKGLSVLPNTMGDMAQLRFLILDGCSRLKSLPYTLSKMTQLRFLNLHGCSGLGSFEDVLVKLATLRKLKRSGTGLSNLKQKDINIYLGFPPDEETYPADRLYESLPTKSLSICRGWEDDVTGEAILSSDIIVPIVDENDDVSGTWENRFSAMSASSSLIIPFVYNHIEMSDSGYSFFRGAYLDYRKILLNGLSGDMLLWHWLYEGQNTPSHCRLRMPMG